MTLDDLVAKPDLAMTLSHNEAFQFQLKALAVVMVCASMMSEKPKALDRALSAVEAAKILGISAASLKRGSQTTYKSLVVETGTRKRVYSEQEIQRFLRR